MSLPVLVGISGASGAIYGVEALRMLQEISIPTHLVISELGLRTLKIETDLSLEDLSPLAEAVYNNKDLGAAISSGSHITRGMIVAPCSIKTLSGIAYSNSANLMIRAADVVLKERRPLVLMVRETPLHKGHLELMTRAADIGAIIHPPLPAFYTKPQSIRDIVRHSVGRALDQLGISHDLIKRWDGG
ncbi:MAG: UbiX family flavin prenyltransferase [Rhodospirillales bacterium]|nr:UbiX family flavin prenyltransferase [Rhodospirillales bacterium]